MKYAIIGGTGVYSAGDGRMETVKTEYGAVQVDVITIDGIETAFLNRHGKDHSVPPHKINYRANMKALYDLGVRTVYASVAVGSMNPNYAPADLVVIKDFLDFTKVREHTYYTGGEKGVRHVELSDPYCGNLRKLFREAAERAKIPIAGDAVYATTEGPRLETAAEIRFLQLTGADVVGMTAVPEVPLAKELGICYAAVGIVTNWCTGLAGEIDEHDIFAATDARKEEMMRLFLDVFKSNPTQESCRCSDSFIW